MEEGLTGEGETRQVFRECAKDLVRFTVDGITRKGKKEELGSRLNYE